MQHAMTHGASLPQITLHLHDADVGLRVPFRPVLEYKRGGAVGGVVVHDDDLEGAFGERCEVLEGG